MTALRSFVPHKEGERALRSAFGRFATGVTIVTAASPNGPVAITANSFSSVSLTPPLVLWALGRSSRRFPYFEGAAHFAIHVLTSKQGDLCRRAGKDMHGLLAESLTINAEGVPVLHECLARFECRRHAVYDGGDHKIIVGEVLRVAMREDGDPLGFLDGMLQRFNGSSL